MILPNNPLFTMITFAVLALCSIVRPTRLTFPVGWYVAGVNYLGETAFAHTSKGESKDEDPPDPSIGMRIYCTGGARPIIVNAQTVGCQARH